MVQIKEIARTKVNKCSAEEAKVLMDKLRKEHSKMVKGRFEFLDAKGGYLEFNYRFFPEDLLVTYKFFHDEICEIPMGLVKHLNNTTKKVRSFNHTEPKSATDNLKGVPSSYTTESRVRFTPVDMF